MEMRISKTKYKIQTEVIEMVSLNRFSIKKCSNSIKIEFYGESEWNPVPIKYRLVLSKNTFKRSMGGKQNISLKQAMKNFHSEFDNSIQNLDDEIWMILNPAYDIPVKTPQEQPFALKIQDFRNFMALKFTDLNKAVEESKQKIFAGEDVRELCTILSFSDFIHSGTDNILARFTSSDDNADSGDIFYDISGELCKFFCPVDFNDLKGVEFVRDSLVRTNLKIAVLPEVWRNIIDNLPTDNCTINIDGSRRYQLDTADINPIIVMILGDFDERIENGEVHWYFKEA